MQCLLAVTPKINAELAIPLAPCYIMLDMFDVCDQTHILFSKNSKNKNMYHFL